MFYVLIITLLFAAIFPFNIFAHNGEGGTFLKIQGKTTKEYHVPTASSPNFILPNDTTEEDYLAGQELSFEIDTTALPIPGERIRNTKLTLDFGDGARAIGLNATHRYANPGTYFINLEVTTVEIVQPQSFQLTAINILPTQDYKLPKSVIKVNNKQSKDPLLDVIEVDFRKEIKFDAAGSDPGDSEIVEYFWDLGDGNSKEGKTFKYKYSENPYIVFPVLRVKTKDGFISDSYVQLSDSSTNFESGNSDPFSSIFDWKVIAISAFLALVLTGLILLLFRKRFTAKGR